MMKKNGVSESPCKTPVLKMSVLPSKVIKRAEVSLYITRIALTFSKEISMQHGFRAF